MYRKSKETEAKLLGEIKALELTCASYEVQREAAVTELASHLEAQQVSEEKEKVDREEREQQLVAAQAGATAANGRSQLAEQEAKQAKEESQRLSAMWTREKQVLDGMLSEQAALRDTYVHEITTKGNGS